MIHLILYIYKYIIQFVHADTHMNSSASGPMNATQLDVMKVSHLEVTVVGPELYFSIYLGMLFHSVCLREVAPQNGY